MLDLLSDRETLLCHLQSIGVLAARTQVLSQRAECVDFGGALANLAGDFDGLLTIVETLGVTRRGGNHRIGFIHSA